MKKILFYGNSHVAALKTGWSEEWDKKYELQTTFWAVPAKLLRKAKVWNDQCFGLGYGEGVTASELASCRKLNSVVDIKVAEFDVIVHVGKFLRLQWLIAILEQYNIEGLHEKGEGPLLSLDLFCGLCEQIADNMLPDPDWSKCCPDQLHVTVASPVPAELILKTGETGQLAEKVRGFVKKGNSLYRPLLVLYGEASKAHRAKGYRFLSPPSGVMADSGLTKDEYSVGSSRLHTQNLHDSLESRHMNRRYGELLLESLISEIADVAKAA